MDEIVVLVTAKFVVDITGIFDIIPSWWQWWLKRILAALREDKMIGTREGVQYAA